MVTVVELEPDSAFDTLVEPPASTPEAASGPEEPAAIASALDALPAAPKRSPWLRSLIVGLLLAALAGQMALVYRKALVEALPQTRPFIERLCANVGCSMALPRDAGAITIETSDLNRQPAGDDMFVLSATLINAAPTAQAYPHLELTLTNAQDKAVVRRVFAPEEWLATAPPDTGFGAHSELAVEVNFAAQGVNAAGYRLYAFYP